MPLTQKWDPRQEMLSDAFEVFMYSDPYLKEVKLHHHDFFEAYYLAGGHVRYTVEGRVYDLEKGDLLLIAPDELHQPLLDEHTAGAPYERIVVWFDCDWLRRCSTPQSDLCACFYGHGAQRSNLLRTDEAARRTVHAALCRLRASALDASAFADVRARAQALELAAELSSLYAERPLAPVSDGDEVFEKLVVYINEHCAEDLTLDVLAARFFVSKYHMSREFKRRFGVTIHSYVVKRRLLAAKQLIRAGAPLAEVYTRAGFADYSNFYRKFREEYGVSPKDFAAR